MFKPGNWVTAPISEQHSPERNRQILREEPNGNYVVWACLGCGIYSTEPEADTDQCQFRIVCDCCYPKNDADLFPFLRHWMGVYYDKYGAVLDCEDDETSTEEV